MMLNVYLKIVDTWPNGAVIRIVIKKPHLVVDHGWSVMLTFAKWVINEVVDIRSIFGQVTHIFICLIQESSRARQSDVLELGHGLHA